MSSGTEPFTCRMWFCLQRLSEWSQITGHPAGVREDSGGGKYAYTHTGEFSLHEPTFRVKKHSVSTLKESLIGVKVKRNRVC